MMFAPLFAFGFDDLVKVLFLVIMVGSWIFSQVAAARNQGNAAKGQQARRPGPAPRPQQPPAGDPVEEFLRRAQQAPAPPKKTGPAKQRVAQPQSSRRPPPLKQRQSGEPLAPPVFRGEQAVSREPLRTLAAEESVFDGGVAQHVTSRLDTSKYEQRAEHFVDEIDQADEKLEEHMHDVFDHKLGQLASTTSDPVEETAQTAAALNSADIAAMLQDPTSMRKAIVLTEILRRPEQRWPSA